MEDQFPFTTSEEERAARRAQRAATRQKRLRERRRRRLKQLLPVLVLGLGLTVLLSAWAGHRKSQPEETPEPARVKAVPSSAPAVQPEAADPPYTAAATAETVELGEAFASGYAVLIDLERGAILAEKNARAAISPASMTKILTLLVAAEQLTEDALDDSFTISRDITDFCFVNGCSVVGLEVGETVSVRELLYGTILSSGADAALGLATYLSGSQEAFVALMNEKLEALGLSETAHFTNCVGLYQEGHLCSVYDMAMILKAAMDVPLCREVLSAHTYATAPTPEHPEGQILSNWFLRKIEDHVPDGFQVVGAKTGYVVQSGNCAASWGRSADGREYLCVTGNAYSSWRAIFDHVALYQEYGM